MFAQPKQVQTRVKNIAQLAQTKKATPTILANNCKQKIIDSNFTNKNAKQHENTKKIGHNLNILFLKLKRKNSATKDTKKQHKRQTNHRTKPWPLPLPAQILKIPEKQVA